MAVKRQVFYSFHYKNDVFRVQQIRNIGALEDNKPVSENEWEQVKKGGEPAIKKWIDDNMKNRSCVVVLIGTETSKREWVKYEIQRAWDLGKGLIGIHVNNLKDPKTGICSKGANPFDQFALKNGKGIIKTIPCKSPSIVDAYGDIKKNLEAWVEEGIKNRD